MDTAQPITQASPKTLVPAQLWIGSPAALAKKAVSFLVAQFCPTGGCQTCITCTRITNQQHEQMVWLAPEKNYTVDQLSVVFTHSAYALEPGQQFFFVFEKAEFMPPACANSLLKLIEEPSPGYNFLFLAQRLDQILPTIRSRCLVTQHELETAEPLHADLFAFFASTTFADPSAFLKSLDASKINERESIELLDALIAHWTDAYKQALMHKNQKETVKNQKILSMLYAQSEQAPMPGSSKIFWKNLFLILKSG